jgi:hypothetical protein
LWAALTCLDSHVSPPSRDVSTISGADAPGWLRNSAKQT